MRTLTFAIHFTNPSRSPLYLHQTILKMILRHPLRRINLSIPSRRLSSTTSPPTTQRISIDSKTLAKLKEQERAIEQRRQQSLAVTSDRTLYFTAIALVLITPPVCWFYYQHRKEHMGKKKEEMIETIKEKRKVWREQMGKS